eukprot:c15983_g1_i2 orf=142-741(+)
MASLSFTLSSCTYSLPTFPLHSGLVGSQRGAPHQHGLHALLRARSCNRKRARCAASISPVQDEWLQKLPDKKKPLYSHSLPCIEAWLRSLGFVQSNEDRAAWTIQRSDWHARLSLDLTDLFIRYMMESVGLARSAWIVGIDTHMRLCLDAIEHRGRRQVARGRGVRRLKTMYAMDIHWTPIFNVVFLCVNAFGSLASCP